MSNQRRFLSAFLAGAALAVMPMTALATSFYDVTAQVDNSFAPESGDYYFELGPAGGAVEYLDVELEFTPAAGSPTEYLEEFETSGGPYDITIENDLGAPETLSNVNYFFSPTEIPLDQLNFGVNPPTANDIPFTPLPGLDGKILQNGDSVSETTPLPASVWGGLALLAGLGMATRLRRQVFRLN